MRRSLIPVYASLIASHLAFAAPGDWQQKLSPTQPGPFPPPRPQILHYEFGWSAFNAGTATADFTSPKPQELQLHVAGQTTGMVRGLWRLDTDAISLCQAGTLYPISLLQSETYSDESRKTTLTFDRQSVSRYRETKPPGSEPPKTKRFKFPNVFDLQSAWLWIRSQPLQQGDVLRFVVYPGASPFYAEVEVVGHERIKVAGQEYNTIKMTLRLQRVSKDLQLSPHQKFKKAFAWMSDDQDRLLLKVQAEIFVGSVWMEMNKVDFAGTVAPPR